MCKIGILSIQGGIEEHENHLKKLGIDTIRVKYGVQLKKCQGLILPGGESTAIGKSLQESELFPAIINYGQMGKPIWGTCAGVILLASQIEGEQAYLKLLDITVQRNGYGRQLDSFKTETVIAEISEQPVPLVFIRAPHISRVGPRVKILLSLDQKITAVRQGNILGTTFHPELTNNLTFHHYFLNIVKEF